MKLELLPLNGKQLPVPLNVYDLPAEGKRDPTKACVQDLMFLSRADSNLGVAFQTHPGSQSSLESQDALPLATRMET